MNDLFFAFSNSLIALGLCIAVGYYCRRRQMFNDIHTGGMAELLVKVTMPCTVFMSLMRPFSTALLLESVATFFITGAIFLLGGVLGKALARIFKAGPDEAPNWQFGVAYGNVGFMGLPVVAAVFGYEGLFYVAMTMASFNLLTFTVGVRMFGSGDSKAWKAFLRSPAFIATIAGLIFFVTGLRLPVALEGGVALIGGITSPISMILIGAILAKQRLKDALTDIRVLPPVAMRLLAIPLVSLLVLRWFIPNPVMLGVVITLMAMPPAAATVIFAEQFNVNAVGAARLVVVGTILCVITVPLISLLL